VADGQFAVGESFSIRMWDKLAAPPGASLLMP
jgi:hypothetical protein